MDVLNLQTNQSNQTIFTRKIVKSQSLIFLRQIAMVVLVLQSNPRS